MASSLDISALPEYIEQRTEIISKSVLGGKSIGLFRLQTGIKTSAALNLLETNVSFGDGKACGWTPAGSQKLSQREINTGNIKVELAYCANELLDTWLQREIEIMAGRESLPFEERFADAVVADIAAKLEKAVWQGDTASLDPNLNKFDGLLKIIDESQEGVVIGEATDMADLVSQFWQQIPAVAYEQGDVAIMMGYDVFTQYIAALVKLNLYHYNPEDGEGVLRVPGSTVRVIAVPGLNGTNTLVGGSLRNFVFGTDLRNSRERVEMWYDKTEDDFKLRVRFNAGVQVAWPDEVIFTTLD